MTLVTGTALDLAGDPVPGCEVAIRLLASIDGPAVGFTAAGELVSSVLVAADGLGAWSAELTPNAAIDPAGTVYLIEYHAPGNPAAFTITVPAIGPVAVGGLLTTPPAAPTIPPAASAVTFAPTGTIAATNVQDAIIEAAAEAGGAPANAGYLVTTANGTLTNEVVVGTTPGGELGGTWAAPTVDATHAGSSHAAVQAAAESTAAAALAAHAAAADPHPTYLTQAEGDARYQATDTDLGAIAALSPGKGDLIVGTAAGWTEVAAGTNGDVLTADSAQVTGVRWATPATPPNALDDLADVTITSPATGAALIYNGTAWIDGPVDLADGDATTGTLPLGNGGTGATTASGARTNLGLGDAATKNTGTAAGTVAAGDDTRITGAATAANLTAHTSATGNAVHGLGTASTKDTPATGNATTGQVVLGSDTRLTDARTPSAHKTTHATGGTDALTASDIGAQASNTLLSAVAGLAANGLVARTSSSAASARTITAGTGLTVTNGDGVSGNPTVAAGTELAGLAGLSATGLVNRTGAGTYSAATIADVQEFAGTGGTWTRPSWATANTQTRILVLGGGGAGGSGRCGTSATSGGGAGGAGGTWADITIRTLDLGSTETVTIGGTSTGGAARGPTAAAGQAGATGNSSSFGSWITAVGGTGGGGGGTGTTNGAAAVAGYPWGSSAGGNGTQSAGVTPSVTWTGLNYLAPAGGGGGGGGIASSTVNTGGAGGVPPMSLVIQAGGGAAASGAGTNGASSTRKGLAAMGGGGGGGGGSSDATVNAGAGGNGGNYGAGGGGGGGGIAGSTGTSGKGGDGAAGYCLVISWGI